MQEPALVQLLARCEEDFDLVNHCDDGPCVNGRNRRFRIAVVGVVWSFTLIVACLSTQPVVAVEVKNDREQSVPTDVRPVRADINWGSRRYGDGAIGFDQTAEAVRLKNSLRKVGTFEKLDTTESNATMLSNDRLPRRKPTSKHRAYIDTGSKDRLDSEYPATEIGAALSIKARAPDDAATVQDTQFQLPKPSPDGETPPKPLVGRLIYEYSYGSESDSTYRRNPDLNDHVRDDFLILKPELNGIVTYRPTDWLETTLEMIFEREIPVREEDRIVLPDGEIQIAPNREFSLIVDQAFVTIKDFTDPFEFTVGRRNFEDDRHWLYDTSLDGLVVSFRQGDIRAELSAGRESWYDLDLLSREEQSRNNTYMLYANYRGIEDIKLAGYTIFRDDRDGLEGQPLWFGLYSQGMVSDNFSYWTELSLLLGEDELSREFSAYGVDIGGTYRFTDLPFNPNVTLGFALGSGDGDPNSGTSNEFRQTGLQSNETKFAGVSEFKVYGEALDPELSNLKILTAGLGFRPTYSTSIDFVYHHYWMNEFADELRNSAITAQMNQDGTQRSKDVGSAFDVVLGIRSLFGVRRLGMDLRAGLFFPGKAFRNEQDNGDFRKADKGISVIAKFWW